MRLAVRLFVSEYLTSGMMDDVVDDSSLFWEGWAMLSAILTDCARLSDFQCVTTLGANGSYDLPQNIDLVRVTDSTEAVRQFKRLAAEADQTLVIAPESEGVLADLYRQVKGGHGNWIGCELEAIQLTTDKYRFYQHLKEWGLPVIETSLWKGTVETFPVVVKPRDGAGGESTWLIRNQTELEQFQTHIQQNESQEFIVQPFQSGLACSVSVLSHDNGYDLFPAGKQIVNWENGFHYSGGEFPVSLHSSEQDQLHGLIAQLQSALPGLKGYWGLDFVFDPQHEMPFKIVEVNPRLTTSYVGYRKLTQENLAGRWLLPETHSGPIRWEENSLTFGKEF